MEINNDKKQWNKYLRWVAIVAVIATIFGLHVIWLQHFSTMKYGEIKNGQLNLQQWHNDSDETLTLDGEWEFYPEAFIISDADYNEVEAIPVIVPGSWEKSLDTNVNYGSYRLQIQLKPGDRKTYGIYVASIQNASRFYINGILAGGAGQPEKEMQLYTPFNTPYIVEAEADRQGKIEIIIETANYVLRGQSGLDMSLQFGEKAVIVKRNGLSILMEQLVFVVFIMHAIYAAHLYIIGIRNKQLLYLAALLIIILLILSGNGNKLIYNWLPLTYVSDYMLKGLLLSFGGIILLRCTIHTESGRFLVIASRVLVGAGLLLACYSLMMNDVIPFTRRVVFPLFVISSVIVSITAILRNRTIPIYRNTYMLFLLSALFGMVFWEYMQTFLGISTLFYPFDLVIAMFCLSSLMFKNYLNTVEDNKQLAAKLSREDKLKDQFLANTSHELRNPLHGILNLSQVVLEREKATLEESSVHNLQMVLSIGRRMNLLLGDLLDVSKLKEQGIQLIKRPVNVHPLVEKTMDSLKYLLYHKEVRIINEVPAQLQPVLADENRLMQVIFNLLHNAIKYTDQGSIIVRAEQQASQLKISVTDTGIGIAPEKLEQIFGSYQQVSRQADVAESGFGLGLSISKQLVELHGGQLQVRSTVGQGSTFYFSIPLANDKLVTHEEQTELSGIKVLNAAEDTGKLQFIATVSEHSPSLSQLASLEEGSVEQQRIKILVVDDDPVNLYVLNNILNSDNDIDIYCTTSALEVLEMLVDEAWDLIISDVMMPDMSGYALTSLIRETYSLTELPILLLTARNELLDIEKGLLAGANDYIAKPVNAIELYARVRTLIRLKRSYREALSLEAAWLQAQIKPHFLVNTLNSIVALSAIDQNEMIELVQEFSQYLRASYSPYNQNRLVSMEQELKLVRSYLLIQQKRFGERLQVQWDVDDSTRLLHLPPFVIQSLVENAVTHGAVSRSEGGTVGVAIKQVDKAVHVTISDNGKGMSAEMVKAILSGKHKGGIGLYNTNMRLKQHYRTGVSISRQSDQGTEVSFTIPRPVTKYI